LTLFPYTTLFRSRLIQEKRDEIQGRLTGLEALRQELTTLLQGWEDCGRPKAAQS
jgi:hypothetical protein